MVLQGSAQLTQRDGRTVETSGRWEGLVLGAPGFETFPNSF